MRYRLRWVFAAVLVPTLALGAELNAQHPADDSLITFDHYHRFAEILSYLHAVSRRYARLATLVEVGRSRSGRPIYAIEINNPQTGPAEEKPGFYVDGNIHGGEVLGGEGALYFIHYLLTRYQRDSLVTALVDSRAVYVVPIVNPDGRVISVSTPENHRWNIRPVDEDGDGRVDEDPPDDVDGDGRILQMRVPDPSGEWTVSTDDARLMERRAESSKGPFYRLLPEGRDEDEDERYNEDRVGGVDLNRNFPSNWHPAQFASGPYPLSEPETRALVEYITSRPNIAAIHTFHTSGGLLLRFPTLADQDWDFPEPDLQDYRAIAEEGAEITGYEHYAHEKQKIVDLMHPGHGVFNDWASNVFGVLAMTTEMWWNALGRGDLARLRWNDDVLDGKGFVPWYPYQHPQLGAIEIGGWDRWSIASPPEPLIAREVDRNVRWVLTFAAKTPRVAALRAAALPGGDNRFIVRAAVANVGWMPTATAHAATVLDIAKPVRVHLSLENAAVTEGILVHDLGVLPGTRGGEAAARDVSWQVRVLDRSKPAEAEIVVRSEKAGTARRRVVLGRPVSQ